MLPFELAGKRIAEDLDAAERSANETLRYLAQLQVSMMNARIDSDIAPYAGQIGVLRIQEAQTQIVEAMSNLAKAHKSMRSDFLEITGWPDQNGSCPTKAVGLEQKVA